MNAKYRVQCCTYNGHVSPKIDLTSWLAPTLSSGEGAGDPPDDIAIGFQEMIPLHLSLVGLTNTALDLHDREIHHAINRHAGGGNETYSLMAKKVLGGIALLVYTRDRTVTPLVVDVRVATAATGIFRLMGNKGAVGVRLTLEDQDGDDASSKGGDSDDSGNLVMTFANAHLAAHDHKLQRRNEDWQSIVQRLVFSPDGASDHYKPSRHANIFKKMNLRDSSGIQIYDTSYLFFFGDLNYRISTKAPKPLPLHLISHKMSNDLPSLLQQDQLVQELQAGRTLHHLREGAITFQPTYKYKVGTVNEFKKFTKRIPGWCDRILFATWADGEEGAGTALRKVVGADGKEKEKMAKRKGAKVELYTSIMSYTQSDHKPVTAIVALPRTIRGSRAARLPFDAPFPIDTRWRRKKLVGWILDRFVGFFWCIIMFAGFGKDARLGITTLAGAAAAWWFRGLLIG